jgi:hypothetical protein
MRKSRFTEDRFIAILREGEGNGKTRGGGAAPGGAAGAERAERTLVDGT